MVFAFLTRNCACTKTEHDYCLSLQSRRPVDTYHLSDSSETYAVGREAISLFCKYRNKGLGRIIDISMNQQEKAVKLKTEISFASL